MDLPITCGAWTPCGHDLRHGYEFTRSQRRAIFGRDGYACKACGDDQAEILHVDHILAICLGGTGDIENGPDSFVRDATTRKRSEIVP